MNHSYQIAGEFLSLTDKALLDQCEVDHYRASGPGGQKRNKTSSAVRLRHRPTELIVTATEERSQHLNKARAVRRLRRMIALNVRTAVDIEEYKCSERLQSCISRDGRLKVGRRDERYGLVVSEILDVLAACKAHVREAARRIGLTTGALVKFIQLDPKLLTQVNRMRASARLKPLR